MMNGVNAITARPGTRFTVRIALGLVLLMVLAAGFLVLWYRHTYNVWPGQGASAHVHWCGRRYESFGGPPETWQQISSQEPLPIRLVGRYPPLGRSRQKLFAATIPQAQRESVSPPMPCAMTVYLRVGPDAYQAYDLEGGP